MRAYIHTFIHLFLHVVYVYRALIPLNTWIRTKNSKKCEMEVSKELCNRINISKDIHRFVRFHKKNGFAAEITEKSDDLGLHLKLYTEALQKVHEKSGNFNSCFKTFPVDLWPQKMPMTEFPSKQFDISSCPADPIHDCCSFLGSHISKQKLTHDRSV